MSKKLNVDRMRKRVNVPLPQHTQVPSEPDGIVIKDAVGRVVRVLPKPTGKR